jgi:hypothetical protein
MSITDQIAWQCCTTQEAYGNHSREASGASVYRRDRNAPGLPSSDETMCNLQSTIQYFDKSTKEVLCVQQKDDGSRQVEEIG